MDKNKFLFVFLILFIFCSPFLRAAEQPYPSYIYDFWGETISAPVPYLYEFDIDFEKKGIGSLSRPGDIFVTEEQEILISDTGNNRIIYLDENLNKKYIFEEYTADENSYSFRSPEGIYVVNDNLYIADSGNRRIVQLTMEGEFVRTITRPETDMAPDINFIPRDVAVTSFGRIYVISEGDYEGLLEFYRDGSFSGFIGAPEVTPSPADIFWRRFATEEQRRRVALFLPTEYNTVTIDETGLVMAATGNEIRRLSPDGTNVIRERGFSPPIGDVAAGDRENVRASSFVDVISRENGRYSLLDRVRGRIFTYDRDGHLLYVFGGLGNNHHLFQNPAAIDIWQNKFVVLDRSLARVMIFRPLEYTRNIYQGDDLFASGRYEQAAEKWHRVLDRNSNFFVAYSRLGRIALNRDDYEEALEKFRLGYDQRGYSQAFMQFRRGVILDNFSTIISLFLSIIVVLYLLIKFDLLNKLLNTAGLYKYFSGDTETADRKEYGLKNVIQRVLSGLKYALHLIFHPFGGFWDLKNEGLGNLPSAVILLFLSCYIYIFMRQYTGFLFNPVDVSQINILVDVLSILLPFVLWSVVNWSLTTLMDGKGTFKDIVIYSSYSLAPFIIINFPLAIISNYMTLDEGAFYYFILVFSILWSLSLLFFGTVVTHDYSVSKSLGTVIAILIGIGTVLFIALLFFSVINLMVGYFTTIYQELIIRVY